MRVCIKCIVYFVQVFIIEVHAMGKRNMIEKRYSEFEALHKRVNIS